MTVNPNISASSSSKQAAASDTVPTGGIGGDVVLLTIARFISLAAGFGTSVVAARVLGATGLGVAGAAITLGTIAALIGNGGLNISAIYYLGQSPTRGHQIVAAIHSLTVVAVMIATLLAVVTTIIAVSFVPAINSLPLRIAIAALAATIVLYEVTGSVLLGLQRRRMYIIVQLIQSFATLIITTLLIIFLSVPAAFVAAAAIAYCAAAAIAALAKGRHFRPWHTRFDRTFSRGAVRMGLRGQAGNLLQYLNLRLDLLIVPAMLDLATAGVYVVAVRVAEVVAHISSSVASFLFPAVAARKNIHETGTTERASRQTLLLVAGAAVPLALLADPILAIAFGSEFAAGQASLRITLVAMIPLSLSRILAGDLKGRGRAGLVSIAAATALAATIVLDLTLIPRYGIEGAAYATLLAYSIGAAILLLAYGRITGAFLGALVPTPADGHQLILRTRSLLRGIHPWSRRPRDRSRTYGSMP